MQIQRVQQNGENLMSGECEKGKFGKLAEIIGSRELWQADSQNQESYST